MYILAPDHSSLTNRQMSPPPRLPSKNQGLNMFRLCHLTSLFLHLHVPTAPRGRGTHRGSSGNRLRPIVKDYFECSRRHAPGPLPSARPNTRVKWL